MAFERIDYIDNLGIKVNASGLSELKDLKSRWKISYNYVLFVTVTYEQPSYVDGIMKFGFLRFSLNDSFLYSEEIEIIEKEIGDRYGIMSAVMIKL